MVVYLLHNQVNGKVYVGWACSFKNRWKEHLRNARLNAIYSLSGALRKYGEANFTHEILAEVATSQAAKVLEKLWIITLRAYDNKIGYNMTYGGDGQSGWELLSAERKQEIIQKRSAGMKKSWKENREKRQETIRKISIALKGRKSRPCPRKGMSFVEYYGKEKAVQIQEKLKQQNLGLKKGVWITNGVKNKVVPAELIPEGWFRGRTQKVYERGKISSSRSRSGACHCE